MVGQSRVNPTLAERVGVRGASTSTGLAERPPHPDPLPLKGEREKKEDHFGGVDIATTMVQTSLPRLTISRSSFGPMKQESFALSTVSLPPTITLSSPASTT